MGKATSTCIVCASMWVASMSFRQHVWRHSVTKFSLPPSPWMLYRLLFHLEWHVVAECGRIVVDDFFSLSPFFSLSLQLNNTIIFFVCYCANFSPYSFNFLIRFYCFYRSFLICNWVLQLHFLRCFIFNLSSYSFNFRFHSYSFYSFSPHSFNFLFHSYSF